VAGEYLLISHVPAVESGQATDALAVAQPQDVAAALAASSRTRRFGRSSGWSPSWRRSPCRGGARRRLTLRRGRVCAARL